MSGGGRREAAERQGGKDSKGKGTRTGKEDREIKIARREKESGRRGRRLQEERQQQRKRKGDGEGEEEYKGRKDGW